MKPRLSPAEFRPLYRAVVDAMIAGEITWVEYERQAGALLEQMAFPARQRIRSRGLDPLTGDQRRERKAEWQRQRREREKEMA